VNSFDFVSNLIILAPTFLLGKTNRKRQNVCIKNLMDEQRGAA